MDQSRISVIICAYNAARTIRACLESCCAQDRGDYEIIVVDDGSTDGTAQILHAFGDRIRVITRSRGGPSAGRNAAVAASQAEFVAFTDSDCLVERDWLSRLLECFQTEEVVAAGGSQKSPADESAFGRRVQSFLVGAGWIGEYTRQSGGVRRVSHNPTCNVIYRRSAFEKLGGFLEGFWPGEDVELDYRLLKSGGKIVFTPQAVVYHYRPADFSAFLRMMERYGWAQGVLVRLHGFFRPIQYLPFVLLAVLPVLVWKPWLALYAAVGAAVYMLVCRWSWSSAQLGAAGLLFWLKGYCRGIIRSARSFAAGHIR